MMNQKLKGCFLSEMTVTFSLEIMFSLSLMEMPWIYLHYKIDNALDLKILFKF